MEKGKTEASSPPSVEEVLSPPALQWPQETRSEVTQNTSYGRSHVQDSLGGQMQWMFDKFSDKFSGMMQEIRDELRHLRTPNTQEIQPLARQDVSPSALPSATSERTSGSPQASTSGSMPYQGENERQIINQQMCKPATASPERVIKETCTTLTQLPMPSFENGSCIEYWCFKTEFQTLIEEKDNLSSSEKLRYLTSAYSGSAKEELRACIVFHIPREGYKRAWEILDARHGDEQQYIRQLVRRVMEGPSLNLDDIEGMRSFRNYLSSCVTGLMGMGQISHANACEVIDAITSRFEGKLRDDYMDEKHKYRKENPGALCGAQWLLTFTEDMLAKAEDNKSMRRKKETRHRTDYGRTFTPTRRITGLTTTTSSEKDNDQCPLCQMQHEVEDCRVFINMSMKDRMALVRRERRCFCCLQQGHWRRDCQRKVQCGIDGCREYHQQVLHSSTPYNIKRTLRPYGVPYSNTSSRGTKRTVADIDDDFDMGTKRILRESPKAIMPAPSTSTSDAYHTTPYKRVKLGAEGTTLITTVDNEKNPHKWIRGSLKEAGPKEGTTGTSHQEI